MIAQIIEKKLRKIGKFEGAKVRTANGVITEWVVDGVTKPSDSELVSWANEIQSDEIAENNQKRLRKRQLLDALATLTGLTRNQVLRCFNEIVKDGNDD